MAKTALTPLAECTLTVTVDGPALEKRRQQIQEAALRYGANADKRLRVDRTVAKQMLADASLAARSGVKVRTFAHAAGLLDNLMGNPPGKVTLGWTAATTYNQTVKHGQADLTEKLVTSWNTLPDAALKGKNGAIMAVKQALAERGIGGRKVAARKRQSDALWCIGQVRSLYDKVVAWSQGKGIKRADQMLSGFNALDILDAMRRGETVAEEAYRAVVGESTVDETSSPPVVVPASEVQTATGRRGRRESKVA